MKNGGKWGCVGGLREALSGNLGLELAHDPIG